MIRFFFKIIALRQAWRLIRGVLGKEGRHGA